MKAHKIFSQWLLPTLATIIFLAGIFTNQISAKDVSGTQSGKWTLGNSPYILLGDVTVPKDQYLTIEPGVVVKFAGYYRMTVRGTLIAIGNSSNRIVFTSNKDFEFGETGSIDYKKQTPRADDWNMIEFIHDSEQPPSEMSNCIIRYSANIIQCINASLYLKDIFIVDCNSNQLYINGTVRSIKQGSVNDISISKSSEQLTTTSTGAKNRIDELTESDEFTFGELSVLSGKILTISAGESGGFAKQLEQLRIVPYIHGYADNFYCTNDINRSKPFKIFDMHYFNMMFGINIADKVVTEIMLEYEHGGDDTGIRYGIFDYTPFDFLTIRSGKFLMPIGKFNEYYYPEYINKLAYRPYCVWVIVPCVWAEVGVQLRGTFKVSSGTSMNYALFIVNGLSGSRGGDIRSMRNNFRDYNDSGKPFGGRIGFLPMKQIEVGASLYKGAYTADGEYGLTITDLDFEFKGENLNLRGEYIRATQQDSAVADIKKKGFYCEAAYRISSYLESTVRYEEADLGRADQKITEILQRVTFGLSIYPEPLLLSRFNFKINYSYLPNNGKGKIDREFVVQTAIGF